MRKSKGLLSVVITALILSIFSCMPALSESNVTLPSTDIAYETYGNESSGEGVAVLQNRLIELGYLSGEADGNYGAQSEAAVRTFQTAIGIEETGIADPGTQALLFAEDAPKFISEVVESSSDMNIIEASSDKPMVWIPTHGGEKYHINKICSGMVDPEEVSLSIAQERGFEPCKQCKPEQ